MFPVDRFRFFAELFKLVARPQKYQADMVIADVLRN